MEIKAVLNKPYSKSEKLNFIIQQSHNFGYKIIESAYALEAWGKTENEIQKDKSEIQKLEIQRQLEELDKKRIRAVCEPSMKTNNQSWLDFYNEEIKKLRTML